MAVAPRSPFKDFVLEALSLLRIKKPLRALQVELLSLRDAYSHGLSQGKGVLQENPGEKPARSSPNLCLFASFSRTGRLEPYVPYYLAALRQQLHCDIVFVSTTQLSGADVECLRKHCRTVILRDNVGIDFGSWKVALEKTPDWREYEHLIIANDSVYGPLYPIDSLLEPLKSSEPTLVGITESIQHEPHLQSYFVAFNRKAFLLPFFEKFWRSVQPYRDKKVIIHRYEIGLSREARSAGCRLLPLIPFERLKADALRLEPDTVPPQADKYRSINPTHVLWKTLFLHEKCPFLKTELIRDNPDGIAGVGELPRLIGERTRYPIENILHILV